MPGIASAAHSFAMSESSDEGQLATDQATEDASTEPATLPEEKRSDSLTKWGVVVSIGYLTFLAILGGSNINGLLSLQPNEFGDMLAGIFSPLAFLWLVLGFLQQGQELRASVRALELQGRELRNSVDQQRQLVAVARDEMTFTTRQFEMREEEEDRTAQPKFALTSDTVYPHPSEPTKMRALFDLKLMLNLVWEVRLFSDGQAFLELEQVVPGDTERLQFEFPKKGSHSKTFSIEYVDKRGNPRVSNWTIEYSDGEIEVFDRGISAR